MFLLVHSKQVFERKIVFLVVVQKSSFLVYMCHVDLYINQMFQLMSIVLMPCVLRANICFQKNLLVVLQERMLFLNQNFVVVLLE